jgi:F-type H+-transporting ATPase subunit epsilon
VAEAKHPAGALRTTSVVDELALEHRAFELVVVSPQGPVYEGEGRFLVVETVEGSMGIWPKHTDIVAALGIGPMRIGLMDGGEHRFAVRGGFLKVTGRKIIVLVDQAERRREVDPTPVRKELEETIEALRHPASDEEFTELLDRRAWCQARLDVFTVPNTQLKGAH